jgi:hypothetical protein
LVPDGDLIEYVCENERDAPHLVGKSGEEFRVPAEVLARYVGTYESAASPTKVSLTQGQMSIVRVSLQGSRLMIDGGAGPVPLIAHGENDFTMEGTGVEFIKDAKGAVTTMLQHWNEGDRYFPRKK